MKNRGFSLIEIVVAVAIMGILSGIVGLQLRSYIAKSKDTKAVATLNTLRVAAQLYQVENEEALIDTASLTTYSEQKVKDALKKLMSLLEPMVVVFLGLIVAFVVVAIYLPILSIGDVFSQ